MLPGASGRTRSTPTPSPCSIRQPKKFRVLALPSKNVGIRKAIIDAEGRYWYMGSHNGRLGMIR